MTDGFEAAPRDELMVGLSLAPTWLKYDDWRRADSRVEQLLDLEFYRSLAVAADAAPIEFLFMPASARLETSVLEQTGGFSGLDTLVLGSALAAVTERIRIVPTVHTGFDDPYPTARRIQTLHQISSGRAGWNAVTAFGGLENHGHLTVADAPETSNDRAIEFIEVVRSLWRSYPSDALVLDRTTGRFADADRVQPIDHEGDHFSVAGPLTTPAYSGREPMLVTAGASEAWIGWAARLADAVFVHCPDIEAAMTIRSALRRAADGAGRDPDELRVLPGIDLCLADSVSAARSIREAGGGRAAGAHRRFDPWEVTGTPADAIAEIERWAEAGAIDGVIALPTGWTGSVHAVIESVAPALGQANGR